jgi:DNA-binding transcriptional LysR family regulator
MRSREFAELRAFLAVADHRSFTRAAAHLGMAPSGLSQVVRSLEERIGVRLLHRTTRSVALSDAGEELLAGIRPAMRDLETAVTSIVSKDKAPAGSLKINSSRLAALHHLAPHIAGFLEAYPNVALDVTIDDALVDIVAAKFDAGIRLGEMLDRDMVAVPLGGPRRMIVVASPDYCRRHGTPETPRDLARHRCLNTRWPTDGSVYRWEFERDGSPLSVSVGGPVLTNEAELLVRAACDGVGIAYLFDLQVEPFIRAGRLLPLLVEWSPPFPGLYLYYPSSRQMRAPLRAFIDFLTVAMKRPLDDRHPA